MATADLDLIIQENVARVRGRIAAACVHASRDPAEVTLIGVTKSVRRDAVDALIRAGVIDLGENRVQDAVAKFGLRGDAPPLPDGVTLHMIGNLQTNKTREVTRSFALVHSLNRADLADALNREAGKQGTRLHVLLEVNVNVEASKQGIESGNVEGLLGYVITRAPHLIVDGLMTIGPHTDDADAVRASFIGLRDLRDALQRAFPNTPLSALSMGMSNDYAAAVEEGATHVRVGRALFVGLPSAASDPVSTLD